MRRFEERWAVTALASFAPEAPEEASPEARANLPVVTPLAGEVDYLQALRTMVDGSNFLGRLGIRLAIWMVAFSPLWALRRLKTFSGLELRQRSELLHRLLEHPNFAVRELCLLIKVVTCMALLAPGPVRARTSFDLPSESPALPTSAPAANSDHQEVA